MPKKLILANPHPARVGKKARKILVPQASMDATEIAEDFHLPTDPKTLGALIEALARHHGYVSEIAQGYVSGTDSVRRLKEQAERELGWVMKTLAGERISLERDTDPAVLRRRQKEIGRLARQCRRLEDVKAECGRYLNEWFEQQRELEAAERLGIEAVPRD